jgi:predicted RNA binding protein YcfA (HicA-like mRNA interferase family)
MRLPPVSQPELIRRLRNFGWEGPTFHSDHPYMRKGELRLRIPNPHGSDISVDLLKRILRQAEISREEWLQND